MGVDDIYSDRVQQDSHLALASLCSRLRCTAMVSDVVGNVVLGAVHSLGWCRWALSWNFALAMARRLRRDPRSGPRYDSSPGVSCYPLSPHNISIWLSFRPFRVCTFAPRLRLLKSLVPSASWLRELQLRTTLAQARSSPMPRHGTLRRDSKAAQWHPLPSGLHSYVRSSLLSATSGSTGKSNSVSVPDRAYLSSLTLCFSARP